MTNASPAWWRAPSLWCAVVTTVAVPFSFFGVLYATTSDSKDVNAVGVACYFFLCHLLAVPLALVNSCLIAPGIARTARGRLSAVGSHLILTIVWVGLAFSLHLALLQIAAPRNGLVSGLLMLRELTMFLGPAVIVGSFAYSLQYNSMQKLTPCA